jgi:hypothetical protein
MFNPKLALQEIPREGKGDDGQPKNTLYMTLSSVNGCLVTLNAMTQREYDATFMSRFAKSQ